MPASHHAPHHPHLTPEDLSVINVNKACLISPDIEPPEELIGEARSRFFAIFVKNYETKHGPLKYSTLNDLEKFLENLPTTINGSGKQYRRSEIGKLVAEVLTGGKTSEFLTSAHGIHDEVVAYQRGRVIQASEQIPNFQKTNINPYTHQPIKTYEDRFLYADQALRFAQLEPETAQALSRGYKNMNFKQRTSFLQELAELHGRFMNFKGQDHLYLMDRDFDKNRKEREKLPKIGPLMSQIEQDSISFSAAIHEGNEGKARHIKQMTDRRVDQVMPLLGTEFKVHIHPTFDLIPAVFDRLLLALRLDPHFRLNIDDIKVTRTDNDEGQEPDTGIVPHIVIYPHRARTIQQSHVIAQRIVERVTASLKDLDHSTCSAHEIPRYNHQISDIVFMAQCGGDMKKDLEAMGLLNHFFDPNYNYGLLRPRYKD